MMKHTAVALMVLSMAGHVLIRNQGGAWFAAGIATTNDDE